MHEPNLFHVDVFATGPLTGNALTVFLRTDGWSTSLMQHLTREMKQFESIFLSAISPAGATARVFTVEEELPFAGHPVLGAAAVLHRTQAPGADTCALTIEVPHGALPVSTTRVGDHFRCEMNQGAARFGRLLTPAELSPFLSRLGLETPDVADTVTAQVVSTGLPYLIVPVRPESLSKAAIHGTDLEALLGTVDAKFVMVLDVAGRELRTWDNLGLVEDVATGSAAGPAAAYLHRLGLADPARPLVLAQGRFANRASRLEIVRSATGELLVSGEVWAVSHGRLDIDPRGLGDRFAG